MARLFPLRSETETAEGQPRVVDLEGEDADAVFSALSSGTAREIYSRLNDEPGTPSDVAEAIDSSIQNVRYHLDNLEDAGLVEVVDTWYSSRGNEMSVYATADGPLIVTSDESRASRLKDALSRFLGGIAALAGGSLLVHHAAGEYFTPADDVEYVPPGERPGAVADDAEDEEVTRPDEDDTEPTPDEDEDVGIQEEPEETPEEDTDDEVDTHADDPAVTDDEVGIVDSPEVLETATTLPPGVVFFLGGLFVLAIVTAYWYWSAGRLT